MEWACERALEAVKVPGTGEFDNLSISQLAEQLWDVDEADRLASLAFLAPTLMDHDEQVLWAIIKKNPYFWRGEWRPMPVANRQEFVWRANEAKQLVSDRLRQQWNDLKLLAAGEAPSVKYMRGRLERDTPPPPTSPQKPSKPKSMFDENLDDDVPF